MSRMHTNFSSTGASTNASVQEDQWLQDWTSANRDREEVQRKVASLKDVAHITTEQIEEWAASDRAKKEMQKLRKVVKSKLFGPIKVTTTEGKTSKLELDKLSYFDVSQLEGCFISPEESDFTRSDTYSTDDSSQDRKGATIESACIHSIKDLWNKIGITEIDAFASRDKGTRGLEKLAWLPDIGNKEISTYLITLKNDISFKSQPLKGERKPGQTHEIHAMISYKRVFIVLNIWGMKTPQGPKLMEILEQQQAETAGPGLHTLGSANCGNKSLNTRPATSTDNEPNMMDDKIFEIAEVKEECTLGSSSLFKFLEDNEMLCEVVFATDGKKDITTYVRGNTKIKDLMKKAKETREFQAKPCIEVTELDASSGTKELLQPIYELQCSIKEIEEFGKTAFYEHEVVNTDILDRLQETMKKLQNKLIESVFMGCETKHTFDTELERLNKEKEKLKSEMNQAILNILATRSHQAETDNGERKTELECLNDREEDQEIHQIPEEPHELPPTAKADKAQESVINVVLIGKTGSGKSATGSLLIGRPEFKSSSGVTSQTKPEDIKVCETVVDGVKYRIIDTPGLFNTDTKQQHFKIASERIANKFPDGVHAFIYVMNGDTRFTQEEAETIRVVRETNGDKIFNYAALLVTRGKNIFQQKDMDAEKYIQEIEQEMTHGSQNVILDSFQDLIKSVGKRVIFIENNDDSRLLKEVQRQCMFCLIGEIAAKNTKPYQMNVSTTMRKFLADESSSFVKFVEEKWQSKNPDRMAAVQYLKDNNIQSIKEIFELTNLKDGREELEILVKIYTYNLMGPVKYIAPNEPLDEDTVTDISKCVKTGALLIPLMAGQETENNIHLDITPVNVWADLLGALGIPIEVFLDTLTVEEHHSEEIYILRQFSLIKKNTSYLLITLMDAKASIYPETTKNTHYVQSRTTGKRNFYLIESSKGIKEAFSTKDWIELSEKFPIKEKVKLVYPFEEDIPDFFVFMKLNSEKSPESLLEIALQSVDEFGDTQSYSKQQATSLKFAETYLKLKDHLKEIDLFKNTPLYKGPKGKDRLSWPKLEETHEKIKTKFAPFAELIVHGVLRSRKKMGSALENICLADDELEEIKVSPPIECKERLVYQDKTQATRTNLEDEEINVVLVGKTGVGKSATGNEILKRDAFASHVSMYSLTKFTLVRRMQFKEFKGLTINIMDTPGVFDTDDDKDELQLSAIILGILQSMQRGVHVFIHVQSANVRFTDEEHKAMKMIEQEIGEEYFDFCVFLGTHGDEVLCQKSIQSFLQSPSHEATGDKKHKYFHEAVKEKAEGRYVMIDNSTTSSIQSAIQRYCVIMSILHVYLKQGRQAYTNDMFQEVKAKREEVMRKLHNSSAPFQQRVQETLRRCLRGSDILLNPSLKYDVKSIAGICENVCRYMSKQLKTNEQLSENYKRLYRFMRENPDQFTYVVKGLLQEKDEISLQKTRNVAGLSYDDITRMETEGQLEEKICHELQEWIFSIKIQGTAQMGNKLDGKMKRLERKFLGKEEYKCLGDERIKAILEERRGEMKGIFDNVSDCFPGQGNVLTKNGPKALLQLSVEDNVLTINGKGQVVYSTVWMFSHGDHSNKMLYICIESTSGQILHVSSGHLLHVGRLGNLIPAKDVRVGDVLFTPAADGLKQTAVKSIKTKWMRGMFCPHTMTGSIIVDGIAASCYTTALSPTVAHLLLMPARLLYSVLPTKVFGALVPYDKESGSPWLLNKYRGWLVKLAAKFALDYE